MFRLAATACVWLAWVAPSPVEGSGDAPLSVFAAASLTEVLEEIAVEFTAAVGSPVVVAVGASSSMARQIEYGAPANIFASAHPQWIEYLGDRDLLVADSLVQPANTQLVLVTGGSSEHLSRTDFATQLMGLLGDQGRLAVGDPDHVPAGFYARQALQSAGLWSLLEPRLARAENVRAALALVSRGEAVAGLVYRSDLSIADVQLVAAVPRQWVAAVPYVFAAVQQQPTHPAVGPFLEFLRSARGQVIFSRHGFDPMAGQ